MNSRDLEAAALRAARLLDALSILTRGNNKVVIAFESPYWVVTRQGQRSGLGEDLMTAAYNCCERNHLETP